MMKFSALAKQKRKFLMFLACCACVWASNAFLNADGWVNWSGDGFAVPLYRGGIAAWWIKQKGNLGYPLGFIIYYAAWASFCVLCASRVEDAAKFALANLAGVTFLGLLAFSPDYMEPCTHDVVLVSAWVGGCAAAERGKAFRAALLAAAAGMLLWDGEVWHRLGGEIWCPMRASEKYGGVLWMSGIAVACATSVFGNIIEARLGSALGFWRIRAASFGLSAALMGAFLYWVSTLMMFDVFGAEELGFVFGLSLPFFSLVLNVVLALYSAVRRFWRWRRSWAAGSKQQRL